MSIATCHGRGWARVVLVCVPTRQGAAVGWVSMTMGGWVKSAAGLDALLEPLQQSVAVSRAGRLSGLRPFPLLRTAPLMRPGALTVGTAVPG